MNDFFDLPEDKFVNKGNNSYEKKTDPNIYNPDPNAYNGSYKSVFRYIPYIFDKSLSKYTKYSAKFWNPLTKESLFVDCPSNVGKPSILWDLERVIKGLKDEEPDLHNELKERFSRWHTNFSPVYIKKDPQRTDLEGQIKIFKFTTQINNLIEEQLDPEEDGLIEVQKVNPYHLLNGKDFLCSVGKKTKQFRDWTKSKFMDEITPFVFEINGTKVVVKNDEKSIRLVQEFLKKNTPKMDEYLHKEWSEDTYEKVAELIISCVSNKAVIDLLLSRTKDEKMKELITSKLNSVGGSRSSKKSDSIIDEEDDIEFTTQTPLVEDNNESSDSSEESDEYDDLFNDL